MALYPTCQHIKTNGEFCQAPALTNSNRCYFHSNIERRRRASAQITRRQNSTDAIQIPPLEDANAVQVAIMETIDGLVDGRLTTKHAQVILGALRTASVNLRHTNFAADPEKAAAEQATEISDDTSTPVTPADGTEPTLTDGRVPLATANYCHAPQP